MSSQLRHEKIGYIPEHKSPIEQLVVRFAQRFVGIENYTPAIGGYQGVDDIYYALEMVAFRHLELPGAQDASSWIQKGFDCALYFFLEDWKVEDDPKVGNMLDAKRKHSKSVSWYRPLSRGMILGLLAERWDEVARLCEWPWASLVPEYSGMGDDLEDEVAQMYVVVAAGLRRTSMKGIDKVKETIRKCRTKRPKLLMKVWDAVESRDQSAFEKALTSSLEHHAAGKKIPNRDTLIAERLALPQTAIALTAMHYGLKLPALPPELAAYLITRQSLGLKA